MLLKFADWLTYEVLGMETDTRSGAAVHFFLYDSVKILLLLAVMIFVVGVIRSYIPERKLKEWLVGRKAGGYFFAAIFGAITPFCSCSSIPIFLGLLRAGVPLGVVFSFLMASPLINEYLVVLMGGFFGWKIAALYAASGVVLAVLVGFWIGRLKLESCLEPDFAPGAGEDAGPEPVTFGQHLLAGLRESASIVRKTAVWVLLGVAAGSLIHNYVPEEGIRSLMEKTGVLSVPLAVLLGVPLYGNCAAIVPVAMVLFQKGIPLGTALAFMMAISALSLPEAIMLRRAMNLKLIGIFFGLAALAMTFTGYLLNILQPFLT